MKKTFLLLCLLVAGMLCAATAMADGPAKALKGNVADNMGPLIGAAVKIPGTNTGTVTDMDGNFTIECEPGLPLEFSCLGYVTLLVPAQDGMQVLMEEDAQLLEEVVVTALGIKRERKALGYGVEEVKG